jgi:hypothetical protein
MTMKSPSRVFFLTGVFLLSACTTITTRVAVTKYIERTRPVSSYAIVRAPICKPADEEAEVETLVRARLNRLGLSYQPSGRGYLISIAFDTRPSSVNVCDRSLPEVRCETSPGWNIFLPFAGAYRHSLTVEFFDAASGLSAYKATAIYRDNKADSRSSNSYLVKSVLPDLLFANAGMYRVRMHTISTDGDPAILSIESVR